ncbi:hypothetical protein [Sediminibacterium sp.]|uniref:hypothetical protein n=1 Tax=Sediminibacterium sp. TaxID=1917865 RepID=UPI003F719113
MSKDPKKATLAERFKSLSPEAKKEVLEILNELRLERQKEEQGKNIIRKLMEEQHKNKKAE